MGQFKEGIKVELKEGRFKASQKKKLIVSRELSGEERREAEGEIEEWKGEGE